MKGRKTKFAKLGFMIERLIEWSEVRWGNVLNFGFQVWGLG